ncbi:MAG: hypothetical protein ACOZNI_05020 [Myxococcota bacterium]
MLVTLVLMGCAGGKVTSEEEAELAYLGLDRALSRALELGLLGFSQADSANLDPQTADGDVSGTMTVTGKADQGSSDNKGLRLDVALDDYADVEDLDDDEEDEVAITYDTDPDDLPYADLQLRDMPDGTLSGTFSGTFRMEGDLEGDVELDLTVEGPTEADPDYDNGVRRVEGETEIEGTATNEDGGVFEVDVTR